MGKGLAGCFTALHYKHHAPHVEVELIHDSKIPAQTVGQATFPETPSFLWDTLEINWYDNPIKASFKTGILYEGWGKVNDKFFHPFPLSQLAVHYDTYKIQDYILQSGKFNVIDKRINNYNEIDSDYIFDCSGFPKDYNDYDMLVNPINAVLLTQKNEVDLKQYWTRTVATPDGWCFIIPLVDSTSYGYLYNANITEEKDAANNFKNIFDVDEIQNKMLFKNYIAKNPIIDDRIIFNGNKLFFLEPLEGTAIPAYSRWIRMIFDWIILKESNPARTTVLFQEYVRQIQNFVLYH